MSLLAVDLGVRAGLALYGRDGKLRWYRSTNFGSRGRMKRGAQSVVRELPELDHLVAEGDARLAMPWLHAAEDRGAQTRLVGADNWRPALLLERQRRSGVDAKRHAGALALAVIAWSRAKAPVGELRHDAAEAILVGLWACREVGWLQDLPGLRG